MTRYHLDSFDGFSWKASCSLLPHCQPRCGEPSLHVLHVREVKVHVQMYQKRDRLCWLLGGVKVVMAVVIIVMAILEPPQWHHSQM